MNLNRCSLNPLHKSAAGRVMICRECQHIHLELGNLLAVVSGESFELILDELREKRTHLLELDSESIGTRKVLVQLTANNLFLAQTREQFLRTLDLLEMANYYLQVHKILQP